MMYNMKIVADSTADTTCLEDFAFSSVPLKIITAEKEYVDDTLVDVEGMVSDLSSYKGKSSTSCPNPEDWLTSFEDYENIFCVTITKELSGSYNAAMIAKNIYEEQHPGRKVFVINSLSAGPELKLIIEKLAFYIRQGFNFEKICCEIQEYQKTTALLFVLSSMKNLANNGRVSPLVAKTVGLLGIRIVGKASDKGDLQPLDKCRGEEKALDTVVLLMQGSGFKTGKVRIAHCFNQQAAEQLKDKIQAIAEDVSIEIYPCGALCSFYAEKGGLLIGFEKN